MRHAVIKNTAVILVLMAFILGAILGTINKANASIRQETEGETGEVLTGWQEIEGNKYYFSPETGEMLTGWWEIEEREYYFSPETGEMLTGWQVIEEDKYYFSPETGEMLTGRQKINGEIYYFDGGILQVSGWIEDGDKTYYCEEDGVLLSGWKKIKNYKYYFSPENNQMVTGITEINNKCYVFGSDGHLVQYGKAKSVKNNKNLYSINANGKVAGGWQLIKNKLYFVSKSGRLKKNTTYQGIKLSKAGAAKNNFNARLKIKVMRIFSSIINENMSKSKKLNACWLYIVGSRRFHYASKYRNINVSGWQKKLAYDMLTTQEGNCYGYSCAFAALAEEAGYKPYIVCGRVHGSRDRAPDGFTRHAWVKINGWHYDPEAQAIGWMRGVYARKSYPASHTIQKIVAY